MNREELIRSVTDEDQRSFIKISVLLNEPAAKIHKLPTSALHGSAHSLRTVQRWVTDISRGRTDLEEARGGPHRVAPDKQERIAAIEEHLYESRGWSVRELALRVQLPKTTVHEIMTTDLGLSKRLGKWVPQELTEDQREFRIASCSDNLRRLRRHPNLLDRTLTIDETWVSLYSPPTRDQQRFWLRRDEQSPKIPAGDFRQKKRMLILAMDIKGVAFFHLCAEGQTVTSEVYRDFLDAHIPVFTCHLCRQTVSIQLQLTCRFFYKFKN
jgi:hypothetical protein